MIELPPSDSLALSIHHAPGTQALLVGSGLSRAAGIPTGWEITLDLVRRLGALKGITEHDDWEKWFRDEHGEGPSYSELVNAVASTAAERRTILHGYIEPPEGDKNSRRPTKAHAAIARLVKAGAVKVIVTTNFDRLIENALRDEGIEPTVIASEDAIAGAEPLVHARCTVIKVHGDYLDNRIKNTDGELSSYGPPMNALLDQVFDNFGLTIVGWSGEWDTALRDAITRQPNRRFPIYWAARGEIGPLAQDLIDQRDARSFAITDADAFFSKLEHQLEALRQATRPHPQSVEMAIALAKRFCRDDSLAMEWTEFLHGEVEKIRHFVTGSQYPTARPTPGEFNELVRSFVIRSEVIRRACLICGRWGTAQANQAVTRAITSLIMSHENRSGYDKWICSRDIAACFCFYWNIIGMLEAENYKCVNALVKHELKEGYADSRLLYRMALNFFGDGSVNWKWLNGHQKNLAPASEFALEMFKSDARDVFFNNKSAESAFDRSEIVIAAVFAREQLDKSHENLWVPIGRFVYKEMGNYLRGEIEYVEKLPEDDPIFISDVIGRNRAEVCFVLDSIVKYVKKNFGMHALNL